MGEGSRHLLEVVVSSESLKSQQTVLPSIVLRERLHNKFQHRFERKIKHQCTDLQSHLYMGKTVEELECTSVPAPWLDPILYCLWSRKHQCQKSFCKSYNTFVL